MAHTFSPIPYRKHFVCFTCRKAVKSERQFLNCSLCGTAMANMGRKFRAPARRDENQWQKIELLHRSGWCGYGWSVKPRMSLRDAKEYLLNAPRRERESLRRQNLSDKADALKKKRARNARRRLERKVDALIKPGLKGQE